MKQDCKCNYGRMMILMKLINRKVVELTHQKGLYMRYFYEMYPDTVICPQVEDELITDANMPTIEEIEAELNE